MCESDFCGYNKKMFIMVGFDDNIEHDKCYIVPANLQDDISVGDYVNVRSYGSYSPYKVGRVKSRHSDYFHRLNAKECIIGKVNNSDVADNREKMKDFDSAKKVLTDYCAKYGVLLDATSHYLGDDGMVIDIRLTDKSKTLTAMFRDSQQQGE